jgi:hypothetical protein
MAPPEIMTVVIAKSGGRTYRGRLYADNQSPAMKAMKAMKADNIDDFATSAPF